MAKLKTFNYQKIQQIYLFYHELLSKFQFRCNFSPRIYSWIGSSPLIRSADKFVAIKISSIMGTLLWTTNHFPGIELLEMNKIYPLKRPVTKKLIDSPSIRRIGCPESVKDNLSYYISIWCYIYKKLHWLSYLNQTTKECYEDTRFAQIILSG